MQNTSTLKGHLEKFKRQIMLAFSKNIKTRQKIEREITLQHKLPTLKIFLIKTYLLGNPFGHILPRSGSGSASYFGFTQFWFLPSIEI